jgi:hypothetical protein
MATAAENRNAQLLRQLRQSRTFWHELDDPPRRALQLRRPTEDQIVAWQEGLAANAQPIVRMRSTARDVVVGWRGFTEADVLGAAVGGDAAVTFDSDLFMEWSADDTMLYVEIADKALAAFTEYRIKKAEDAKN